MTEVVEANAPEVVLGASTPAENGAPVQNAEEQATSEKPESGAPETAENQGEQDQEKTQDHAAKKGQARLERRINRLYRERAEAVAKAELLEKQLQSREQPAHAQASARPKFEDYNYDPEAFAKAVSEYERKNAITEYESKRTQEAQEAQRRSLQTSWEKKVERAEAKYDDFDSVVGDLKPTTPWATAVLQAENGEDVAYHLGTNMKEAQRIAALDPVMQILEIGRLSAKLAATPAQKPMLSKAPKPIEPLQGASGGAKGEPDITDTEKWIKWRQKQVHGR